VRDRLAGTGRGTRGVALRIPAPLAVLVAGFLASRLVFDLVGVRFLHGGLPRFFQYIEPELLRERLLESVFYLHSQPPLFNLFLGVGLKLAPDDYALLFRIAFHAAGLVLVVALYRLLVAFRFSPWAATAVALLGGTAPAVVLTESWLFYDHVVAALLVVSVLAFHAYAARPSFARASAFFGLAAVLVLTRSVFQLVWLGFALALALVVVRTRRTTLLAAALPLVLVVGVYAKNAVVFGTFSTSSWYGLSLARTVLPNVEIDERRRLVREGTLSPLALRWPYSPLSTLPRDLVATEPTGVPVLDRETKASGATNFNHLAYVRLSARYADDALTVVRREPAAYLRGVALGAGRFFDAGTDDPGFRENARELGGWARAYEQLFARIALPSGVRVSAVMLLYALAIGYAAALLVAALCRDRRLPRETATLAYALGTVLYIVALWVATDNGETFRARMLTEPLVLFLLLPLAVRAALGLRMTGPADERDAGSRHGRLRRTATPTS
jgi:hypothetical protein